VFVAEEGMARMLDIKGRTGGLSTDQLDGRNCHIFLDGWPERMGDQAKEWGNVAAIGRDIVPVELATDSWGISILDINITLNDCERGSRHTEDYPDFIVVPSTPRIWPYT
jgi:hypothetical protein